MKLIKSVLKALILICIGGLIYVGIELCFRGYSHVSMFIVGGVSFYLVGLINNHFGWSTPFIFQMIVGGLIITLVEFITGCVINLGLGLNVWDYTGQFGSILGQICIPFSTIWILLSAVCIFLDDYLRWKLFNEEKPHYKWL